MATIRTRRLDSDWDYVFGGGDLDWLEDLEAVAQMIKQRLLLFSGEWWADTSDGLPVWQSILGVPGAGNNLEATDRVITERILGTPYVTAVKEVSSSYVADSRRYQYSAKVDTAFGAVVVSNTPWADQ